MPYPAHGWRPDRTASGDPRRPKPVEIAPWEFCVSCWGQRLQYVQDAESGQWFSRVCPDCLGIGDRPATREMA